MDFMTNREKIAVSTAHAPAAIGPYSQAVCAAGLVYTSGQIGLDPATGNLVEGGIEAQTERVFLNLKAVLAAAESDLSKIIKTTVFLSNMNDFAAMNQIYAKYLAENSNVTPSRSTVEVTRLPKDALVEIEVIALL